MFTLYKASAGSGKTSRLVVEYLALCLPQPEKFKHVLAITFTNNATAEMKTRIVDTLSMMAFEQVEKVKYSHLYKQVVAKTVPQLSENEQFSFIQKQAKILLEKILYEYDRFSISTIDAFFQRILRAFALEFGLNTSFNLEIDTGDFFKETISVLLHRISKNNTELTDRVLDLVENLMLEKGKWKMEREIVDMLKLCMQEEYYFPLKKLQESENKNFEQAKKKITQEIFRTKAQLKNFKTKEEKKSETYLLFKEELKELEFFGKNIFQLALLFDLKTIMDEIKAQDNRFFISETNTKISEKLGNDDVPFIYEKIGNQYAYFFIDEFQDTSKLQWNNLIPLIKNALSGYNKFKEQGQVFLFGDLKQAIYRFRNGDADILKQLSNIEGYRAEILPFAKQEEDYFVELLDTNYRSSKRVVEFNNAFFRFLTSEAEHFKDAQEFYEDVIQKTKSNDEDGVVTVRFKEEEDGRSFEEYCLAPVLETINAAVQRGYAYENIAILVSGNELASAIGSFLVAQNLPIISAESLKLSASPEINLLIATMQYLISNEDRLAKLSIIHHITKKHNLDLEPFIQYTQGEFVFQQFLRDFNIEIDRKKLNKLSLFTLVHEVFGIFSFSLTNPFLMRLLDESETFSGTIPQFLEWWEEQGNDISLSTPQGINAITVSTVHKAKGLEYEVVIFPFSQYIYKKTKSNIFVQDKVSGLEYDWVTLTNDKTPERYLHKCEEESKKSYIDQLNKLYVAHTRASKELHIITGKKSKGNFSKLLASFLERYEVSGMGFEVSGEGFEVQSSKFKVQGSKIQEYNLERPISPSNFEGVPEGRGSLYNIKQQNTTADQQRGIFIHNFLSSLQSFPQSEKEIEIIVQNAEENYKEDLVSIFYKILNDKTLQPCFAPNVRVLNETSILFPNGNLLRPDRVVFLEDKVVVIDYKTGEANAAHKEQIEQYCDAIRDMGYKNVEEKIFYV